MSSNLDSGFVYMKKRITHLFRLVYNTTSLKLKSCKTCDVLKKRLLTPFKSVCIWYLLGGAALFVFANQLFTSTLERRLFYIIVLGFFLICVESMFVLWVATFSYQWNDKPLKINYKLLKTNFNTAHFAIISTLTIVNLYIIIIITFIIPYPLVGIIIYIIFLCSYIWFSCKYICIGVIVPWPRRGFGPSVVCFW